MTANFFATLGVRPEHGSLFSADANEPGAGNQVILGHGLWRRRFGGDTNIVGRGIQLTGESYTVVGIMPARMRYPQGMELWAPLTMRVTDWSQRDSHHLRVVGRLKPGSTADQALAELQTVAGRRATEYPRSHGTRSVFVSNRAWKWMEFWHSRSCHPDHVMPGASGPSLSRRRFFGS